MLSLIAAIALNQLSPDAGMQLYVNGSVTSPYLIAADAGPVVTSRVVSPFPDSGVAVVGQCSPNTNCVAFTVDNSGAMSDEYPFVDGGQIQQWKNDGGLKADLNAAGEFVGVHFRNGLIGPPPSLVTVIGATVIGPIGGAGLLPGSTDTAGVVFGIADGGTGPDGGATAGTALFILCPGTPYVGNPSFFNCSAEPYGPPAQFSTLNVFGNNVIMMPDGGCSEAYVASTVNNGIVKLNPYAWSYICQGY
jgi:hypothetical protein